MEPTEKFGYAFADTPDGTIIVVASEAGVVYVGWGGDEASLLEQAAAHAARAELVLGDFEAEQLAVRVAALAADPGSAEAAAVPLDLRGTPFQRQVWQALREIPAGETRTYGEVATEIGRPRASRAVGAACGANPAPIVVPCHRVVAAGGGLGGFSGELWRKEAMLERERTR